MTFPMAYLHLTLARFKGQGHVQFHCQYLANGDIYANVAIANKEKVARALAITIFKFDLSLFKRSTW